MDGIGDHYVKQNKPHKDKTPCFLSYVEYRPNKTNDIIVKWRLFGGRWGNQWVRGV
jgi:hypothetical protein